MALKDELISLVEATISPLGYRIYKLNLSERKKMLHLDILIEKGSKRLDLDEIVEVSELISNALDAEDLIASAYMLDVGSAGAEKNLRINELSEYVDMYVHVKFKEHVLKNHELQGTLSEVNEESIKLITRVKTKETEVEVNKRNIANIRLAIKY